MILPEDTKIGPTEEAEERVPWGDPQPASTSSSRFPPATLARTVPRWATTEDFAAGPSDGSTGGPIIPITSFTRMTEQYGTTRLDAMDSDEDEEGVGEELPRYTRRGTRSSRSPAGDAEFADEDGDSIGEEGKAEAQGWRGYLGLHRTEASRRRRLLLIKGGLLAFVLFLGGHTIYSTLLRKVKGAPPWRDRRMGYAPHTIPVDTDGEVFYCTNLEREDTTYKDDGHRALNTTFYLPSDIAVNFLHVNGPYSIGDVIVSSYQPSAEDIAVATETLGTVTAEPVRVIVEAIYRSEVEWKDDGLASDSDLSDDPTDTKRSTVTGRFVQEEDSWAELEQTSMCVMKKVLNETESGRGGYEGYMSQSGRKRGLLDWWSKGNTPGIGMGVGIYTQSTQKETVFENKSRLEADVAFRVNVQMPISTTPHVLSALDIITIMMDHRLADISNNTSFKSLQLRSSLGSIIVDGVSAHCMRAQTAGMLSISANISKDLDLDSTQGEIDASINVIKPAFITLSGIPSDGCTAPAVEVRTKMGSGNTALRFLSMDEPCRQLVVSALTQLGNIEVHQHPAFQGNFEMSTQLGSLDLRILDELSLEDPLGLGRHRSSNATRSTPIGNKLVSGNVAWVNEEGLAAGPVSDAPSSMRLQSTLGSVKLVL